METLDKTLGKMSNEELVQAYCEAYEGSLVRSTIQAWCNMTGKDLKSMLEEYPEWQI